MLTAHWYLEACQTLAYSIKKTNTIADLIALVTPAVNEEDRAALRAVGWTLRDVDVIENPNKDELTVSQKGAADKVQINKRDTFADTYIKLRVWQLTDYEKVVWIDSDLIFVRNVDELFQMDELSAGMDCCDMFNSGVMVLRPSQATFEDMVAKIPTIHSYDGGDQGFLNVYFKRWNQLPHIYNALQQNYIINKEAYRLDQVKIIHYVAYKPWLVKGSRPEVKPLHDIWFQYLEQMKAALPSAQPPSSTSTSTTT